MRALANHVSRGTYPYEKLFAWCDKERISPDWLLFGEGIPKLGNRLSQESISLACIAIDTYARQLKNDVFSPKKRGELLVVVASLCQSHTSFLKLSDKEEKQTFVMEIASQIMDLMLPDSSSLTAQDVP